MCFPDLESCLPANNILWSSVDFCGVFNLFFFPCKNRPWLCRIVSAVSIVRSSNCPKHIDCIGFFNRVLVSFIVFPSLLYAGIFVCIIMKNEINHADLLSSLGKTSLICWVLIFKITNFLLQTSLASKGIYGHVAHPAPYSHFPSETDVSVYSIGVGPKVIL